MNSVTSEPCNVKLFESVIGRGGFRGGRGGLGPPFFRSNLFFCDNFEELQTVLIEVKQIINNAPLKYVYPNTIKTYLTTNHLLFGRQLLCYFNTILTVIRNLIVDFSEAQLLR